MRYEISPWQTTMILVCINLSVLVSYAPVVTGMLPPTRDAWLAALLSVIPGSLLVFVAYTLVKRFQGQNVYEFIRTIFGRFFGTIISITLIGYFIHWATIITREFSLFMVSVVYLRTPEVVFVIIFVILGFVGASQQIEFIGRAAEFAGVFVIAGTIFLICATIPEMDFRQLLPVLGEGWRPVWMQSLTPMATFGEAVWVVLLAVPYINKMKDAPRAIAMGLGVIGLFGSLSAAVLIAIFGTELSSIIAFLPLSAARLIQIGDILERLEWILLLLWFGSMGIKVSLLMFGARLGLSSLFPGWRINTSLFITTAAVFGWSFVVFPTLTDILRFFEAKRLLPQLAPPLLLPVLMLVVAMWRGVKTDADARGGRRK